MSDKYPVLISDHGCTREDLAILCERAILHGSDSSFLWRIYDQVHQCGGRISLDDLTVTEGISLNGLRKRLNNLVTKGVILKSTEKTPGGRKPGTVFQFMPVKSLNKKSEKVIVLNTDSSLRRKLQVSKYGVSSKSNPGSKLREIILAMIFSGISYDGNSKKINSSILWEGEIIDFEMSSAATSSKINRLIPKFYMLTMFFLEREIKNSISKRGFVGGMVNIDLTLFHEMISLSGECIGIDECKDIIMAMSEVILSVKELPQKATPFTGLRPGSYSQSIRLVSNIGLYSDENGLGEYVVLDIPMLIVKPLMDGSGALLGITDEELKEKDDLLLSLRLWRKIITKNRSALITKNISDLRKSIAPMMKGEEFYGRILALLGGDAKDEIKLGGLSARLREGVVYIL